MNYIISIFKKIEPLFEFLFYLLTIYIITYSDISIASKLILFSTFTFVFIKLNKFIKKSSNKRIKLSLSLFKVFITLLVIYCVNMTSFKADVVYFENEKGQEIIVHGMVHIADKEFFEKTNQFVSEKKEQGFIHLYEGIIRSENHSKDVFNSYLMTEMRNNLLKDDLYSQSIYFDDDDVNDIRADVSTQDLIDNGLKDRGLILNLKENKDNIEIKKMSIENNNNKSLIGKKTLVFMLNLNKTIGEDNIAFISSKLLNIDINNAVIKYRNNHLLSIVDQKLKTNDKILITYGNTHIDGIKSLLHKRGFKITNKNKVVAIKI